MAQTLLAFDHHPADPRTGFELGWDHAHHGVVPPPEQLHDGNPLRQGWQAGKACFGQRTLAATRHTRRWLQLRLNAWLRARAFELMQVTPHYLAQIDVAVCPITRQALEHGSGTPADASIDRVFNDAGYAAGNLAVMSAKANQAKGSMGWQEALVMVQHAEGSADGLAEGLCAAEWSRLAVLMSFVTVLPHRQAACLPLLVLPPNRLRLLNPVQGLQALVTRELGQPAWCQRMRVLADALPGNELRVDFNLLLNALLPRLIEAARGHDAAAMKLALEDAWANPLVNRRWQRFALQLDEPQVESLLRHCASRGLASGHWLLHERVQATEGWALETRGYASPRHAACNAWPPAVLDESLRIDASSEDGHHLIAEGRQLPIGRPQLRSVVDVTAFDHQ
jgi:hypothetical protein